MLIKGYFGFGQQHFFTHLMQIHHPNWAGSITTLPKTPIRANPSCFRVSVSDNKTVNSTGKAPMKHFLSGIFITTTMVFTAMVLNACSDSKPPQISFSGNIHPILNKHCMECHQSGGPGFEASGLNMQSYDTLMKGTKFGPVIKPGDAISSTLVRLI